MVKSGYSLILLFIVGLLLFTSCEKNIDQAKKSLVGKWQVTEIYSYYGTRSNLGTSITQDFTEKGSLGIFEFSESTVSYSYKRRDTLQQESEPYTLSVMDKKNGFINSPVYTLSTTAINYECKFGDETSDAQKNANSIILNYESPIDQPYSGFSIYLKK